MRRVETTVLVVGAGPVGLTAATLLSRLGLANLLVDRREGPHRAPQAHAINPRSLEIFRSMGLDLESLQALATPREDGSHVRWMTRLAGRELGSLCYERQGGESLKYTPAPLLNLSQHLLEPILVEHLQRTQADAVRYRHQCETVEQDADGVTALVRDLARDETYEVRSRYLFAADGAGSRIRRALGIEMIGPDRIQSFVMVHFEANLRSLVAAKPAILYWLLDPDTPGTFVAHHIEHTWVFMHPFDPTAEAVESFTDRRCEQIVRAAIGRDDVPFTVRNCSIWTMTAQIAARYRDGRVFLVGDSAHRFPPTGGMGMNTGIQDAHNLAWKLAAVEADWAAPGLLDTYEVERRAIAQYNADQSMTNALKLLEVYEALGLSADREASRARLIAALDDPAAMTAVARAIENQRDHFDMVGLHLGFRYEQGALVPDGRPRPSCENPVSEFVPCMRSGARLPHAWVENAGQRVSTLDLIADDRLTLVLGTEDGRWERALPPAGRIPLHVVTEGRDFRDPQRQWASLREVEASGAVLVRPDQHVAWYARTGAETAGLAPALAAVTRSLG